MVTALKSYAATINAHASPRPPTTGCLESVCFPAHLWFNRQIDKSTNLIVVSRDSGRVCLYNGMRACFVSAIYTINAKVSHDSSGFTTRSRHQRRFSTLMYTTHWTGIEPGSK